MGGMTTETTRHSSWLPSRPVAIVTAVLLLVGIAVVLVAWADQQRESDRRVDGYYCTLSGVGLDDRGPETGELCADLLYGD